MSGAAVIGVGFIGRAHVEALRRVGVPVAGVLGGRPESTARAAKELGLRAYASLEEVLADPEVSVVHSCGPNDVHAAQNLAALAAGKAVFSEKPLGVSVEECERQLAAARSAGQRHAVHFTYRGYAAVQTLREIVLGGELGEVHTLRGQYLQDWLLYPDDYNWRVTAPAAETRAVADIGSHLADLARYATGLEPQAVYARFRTLHPQRLRPAGEVQSFGQGGGETTPVDIHTEDHATLLVDYPGGVRATFEVSQVAPGHKNDLQLEIQGTRASALWRQERPEELVLGSRERRRTVRLKNPAHPFAHYPDGHPEGYPDAIANLVRAFHRPDTSRPYPTFEDGLAAARFVAAAHGSSVEGRAVGVSAAPGSP